MPFSSTTPFYHTHTHNSIKTVYFALTWKFQKLIPPPAYSDEEINTLWSKLYEINNVDIILIMIYTGLRPTELLEIITPMEPTWMTILTRAWENSKWNTCPTMADTPLLHLWTAPEQMTYVSNWLWDTVWKTTPPRERTPIRL